MKLVNRTPYDPRALRTLLVHVHARVAQAEGRLKTWDRLVVTVVRCRVPAEGTGRASLAGWWMRIRLGDQLPAHKAAWLIEHELLHCYGYRHAQMPSGKHWPTNPYLDEHYAWAKALFPDNRIPLAPVVATPPKPDLQVVRYQRVLAGLQRWTIKFNRAKHALARLRQSQRYYEQALAAKGKLPAAGKGEV